MSSGPKGPGDTAWPLAMPQTGQTVVNCRWQYIYWSQSFELLGRPWQIDQALLCEASYTCYAKELGYVPECVVDYGPLKDRVGGHAHGSGSVQGWLLMVLGRYRVLHEPLLWLSTCVWCLKGPECCPIWVIWSSTPACWVAMHRSWVIYMTRLDEFVYSKEHQRMCSWIGVQLFTDQSGSSRIRCIHLEGVACILSRYIVIHREWMVATSTAMFMYNKGQFM